MRILLTRDPAQSGRLEEELHKAGVDIGFLPLTEQRIPEDLSEVEETLAGLVRGDFGRLLLTSGNTVRALRLAGWRGELPPGAWTGVVGPGTARVLAELTAVPAPWMPAGEKSAAGILEELPEISGTAGRNIRDERILLPQSAQARPQLAEGLREAGFQLVQVTAYETASLVDDAGRLHRPGSPRRLLPVPAPGDILRAEELHAEDTLLITSSSAAEAFAALEFTARPHTLAIGRPTAETLRSRGVPAAAVLREATAAGALRALRHSTG